MEELNAQLIYLIDEGTEIRDIQAHYLKGRGFNVILFDNAERCLHSFEYLCPDALVTNVSQPGINGFELCKLIKTNDQYKNVPVVLVSDQHNEQNIEIAFELGADDYLEKPYKLGALHARLIKLL